MLSPSLNKDFTYLLAYLPIYSWKTYSIITIDFSNFFFLFDLILYAQSIIFQLWRDGSTWIAPVLMQGLKRPN